MDPLMNSNQEGQSLAWENLPRKQSILTQDSLKLLLIRIKRISDDLDGAPLKESTFQVDGFYLKILFGEKYFSLSLEIIVDYNQAV